MKKDVKKSHLYLPCLTEAANSCSGQAHYNGEETVEVPLCFTAIKDQWSTQFSVLQSNQSQCSSLICHRRGQHPHARLGEGMANSVCDSQSISLAEGCENSYLLSSDLDELLDELDPFAERWAQQHLGHHPQLDLIAALQQQLQRHRVAAAAAAVATEGEIHQFLL